MVNTTLQRLCYKGYADALPHLFCKASLLSQGTFDEIECYTEAGMVSVCSNWLLFCSGYVESKGGGSVLFFSRGWSIRYCAIGTFILKCRTGPRACLAGLAAPTPCWESPGLALRFCLVAAPWMSPLGRPDLCRKQVGKAEYGTLLHGLCVIHGRAVNFPFALSRKRHWCLCLLSWTCSILPSCWP